MKTNYIIANTNKKSYLPHMDKLPKIAIDYVWHNLLKEQDNKTKELFFIIRKSQEINISKYNGITPIPYKLIKKEGYSEALEILKSLNIVKFTEFSISNHKCRKYCINWNIYYEIEKLIPARVKDYYDHNWQMYNGITNKAVRKSKKCHHEIYKYNKRKKKDELIVSQIVANGILPIKYCKFDYISVEKYLNSKREDCLKGHLRKSEELKYLNNERCYRNILMNGFKVQDNLLIYCPKYRGQKTGRRSEIGGGFQSCSREMKHEAFNSVSNIRNYDLKSSQMYGLKYAFISARFDTSVVDKYFGIDKAIWASKVGIDKDTWKGLMYGAYFDGFPLNYFKKDDTIMNKKTYTMLKCEIVRKHICKFLNIEVEYNFENNRHECEDTKENNQAIKQILLAFYIQNKELIKALQKWRDYLVKDYFNSNYDPKGDKKYIWNRSNMPIEMTQYMNTKGVINSKGKRDLASHILQGQEALFISYITSYSVETNCPYKVIADQHDGVIVEGEITQDYQERARRDSGFEYAYMEEKSYK